MSFTDLGKANLDSELLPSGCAEELAELEKHVQQTSKSPVSLTHPHLVNKKEQTIVTLIGVASFLFISVMSTILALSKSVQTNPDGQVAMSCFMTLTFFLLLVGAGHAFTCFQLKRARASSPLGKRAHAGQFAEDGHPLFCVASGTEDCLPVLRLQKWEPIPIRENGECLRMPEGYYRVTTVHTAKGDDAADVIRLGEALPELEERACQLEERAAQLLHAHRQQVQIRLLELREQLLEAESSARLFA